VPAFIRLDTPCRRGQICPASRSTGSSLGIGSQSSAAAVIESRRWRPFDRHKSCLLPPALSDGKRIALEIAGMGCTCAMEGVGSRAPGTHDRRSQRSPRQRLFDGQELWRLRVLIFLLMGQGVLILGVFWAAVLIRDSASARFPSSRKIFAPTAGGIIRKAVSLFAAATQTYPISRPSQAYRMELSCAPIERRKPHEEPDGKLSRPALITLCAWLRPAATHREDPVSRSGGGACTICYLPKVFGQNRSRDGTRPASSRNWSTQGRLGCV